MNLRWMFPLAAAFPALVTIGSAQTACPCEPDPPNATTIGVEQLLVGGDETYRLLSFRYTDLPARGAGFELGVSVLAADGLSLFVLEIGPSTTIPADFAEPHVRGGLTLVMGIIPALYLGGGVTVPTGGRIGIRFDVTHRIMLAGDGSARVWSVGIGLRLRSKAATP